MQPRESKMKGQHLLRGLCTDTVQAGRCVLGGPEMREGAAGVQKKYVKKQQPNSS